MRRRWGLKSIALCIASLAVLALAGAPIASAATAPVLTGSYSDPTSVAGATSTAISGHYAYTTAYGSGELTAIDISNPAAPVVTGSSQPSNNLLNATTVNISGGIAYVVSKNRNGPCQPGPAPSLCGTGSNDDGTGNSLTLLDVSTNPANPTIMGTIRDPVKLFGGYGVAVSGHYAYVAAQGCLSGQPCPDSSVGNALQVIDVSNPASPTIVRTIHNTSLLNHADGVTVAGNYAYVSASYGHNMTIVDISSPTAARIVGHITDSNNISFPVDTVVKGKYAYVGNQSGLLPHLAVVDISNPASPTLVTTLTDPTNLKGTYRLRLRGNFIYASAVNVATVSAIDISNPTSPRLAGAITDTTHLNRTTGLDVDPTGKYVVANSPYLASQSNGTYPPFTTNTGTISVVSLDPQPIGVTIAPGSEPPNSTTQTSAQFTFSTTDVVASTACQLDGGAAGPCTAAFSQSYSSLPPGAHTFTVTATDAAGSTASASYSWTIQQAPANTTSPSISGSAVAGQTLTAADGTWTGTPPPTYTRQWSSCDSAGANCQPVSGATGASYTVQPADAGRTLEVTVTATNSVGSAAATSAPTATVTTAGPVNTTAPAISGTASQGQTLTVSNGTWTATPPASFSYQWLSCDSAGANCQPISGATANTYTAQASDVGLTLSATVTATNSGGSSSAGAAATARLSGPPVNTAAPSISGTAAEGQTLTAAPGTWGGYPAPSFAYQWSSCDSAGANCQPVSGATGASYTVQPADAGRTLEVTVTATNSVGSAAATSAPTATVTTAGPVNTTAPAISGTASQGQTLTVSNGTWTATPPASFSYQWLSCDSAGANCQPISGATANTYTAQASDVGLTLSATVTATNSGGSSSAGAAATARLSGPPVNTAAPSISGTAAEGQTLTAAPGTWGGYPAPSFAYQWSSCDSAGANCQPISGATASQYVPLARDVGATLAVRVTATNSTGQAQSTSSATAVIVTAAGPVTKLLDDFNRTNNTGPPSTSWTRMPLAPTGTTTNLLLSGQQAAATASNSADFWNAAQFGPAAEDWVTVAAKPAGDNEPVILGLRVQSASATTASGYFGYFINRSPGTDQYKITIRVNGVDAGTLASATGPELSPGDRLLFRANGPSLELWRGSGGTWTLLLTATDTRITGAGSLALWTRNTVVRLDDFGGGTLP